mgnify:CR=1 FL=1
MHEDRQTSNSEQEVNSVDLPNPYPRQVIATEQPAWSEQWPWEWTPYASFALSIILYLARREMSERLGLGSPKLAMITFPCLVSLILWAVGCYVTFCNAIVAVERMRQGKPWFAATLKSLCSSLASLMSASAFPLLYLGNSDRWD